ncbi:MAG: hypothetical protein EA398_03230 [Deltaproteobacteria bacterium]|nr:MAG: hypothetical protein EA398_03230 [Deltaproteobacteria bacterium]
MSTQGPLIVILDPVEERLAESRAALTACGWSVETASSRRDAARLLPEASLVFLEPAAPALRELVGEMLDGRDVPVVGASGAWTGEYNRALAVRLDGLVDLLALPAGEGELDRIARRFLGAPPEREPAPSFSDRAHAEAVLDDEDSEEFPMDPGATRVGDVQSLIAEVEQRTEQPTPPAVDAVDERPEARTGEAGAVDLRSEAVTGEAVGVARTESGGRPDTPTPDASDVHRVEAIGSTPPAATDAVEERPERVLLVPRVLDPAAVPAQGTFEDSVWPAVLTWLGSAERTGFLLMASGGERLILGFERSLPVTAESNRLPFVDWLAESGLIDVSGVDSIREVGASTGRPERDLLDYGRKGLQLDVADLEAAWLRALLGRPFGWDEGRFAWRDEAVAVPMPAASPVDLRAVLWEGIVHAMGREPVDGLLRPFARQPVAFRREGQKAPEDWWCSSAQRAFLARLEEEGVVERTAEERRDPAVAQLVLGLITAGLAGFSP